MTSKIQGKAEKKDRPKPPNAGKGRQKGVPNKVTKALKDAILGALEEAGGKGGSQAYLVRQARKRNPMAFMALLGKVLPTTIQGGDGSKDGEPLQLLVTFHGTKPKE